MEGLNPNPKKETINEKMNAEKKVTGEVDADNIMQKEKPFSFQVDEGWTVHSNMRGEGESEKANANGTPSPAVGKLGQVGTPVAASKISCEIGIPSASASTAARSAYCAMEPRGFKE